jgi:hypothetical protein
MFERRSSTTCWALWSKWVLANFTGGLILLPVSFAAYQAWMYPKPFPFLEMIILTSCVGAVMGVFHYLVIRGQISRAGWLIPVNVLGYSVGVPMGLAAHLVACAWADRILLRWELWPSLSTGVVLAGLIMLLQWLVWRREIRGAGWSIVTGAIWVTASVAGALIARPVYYAMPVLREFVAGAASGIVFGGITGVAVVGAWRRASPSPLK